MVVFGGLELVAGGYLVHRYHKNKNEKKRLEIEAQQRRHNTFPGAKPQPCYPYQQPAYAASQPVQCPPQKCAYYAPQHQPAPQFHPPPQPQPQPQPQSQFQFQPQPHCYPQPRPQPMLHTQSFEIPRRPVPQPQPQPQPLPQQYQQQPPPIIIQPLQRADSFATISRMPIANGYRPTDMHESPPPLPPRQNTSNLSPIAQSPYSSAAFSVSSPALGHAPPTVTTPVYASPLFGRQTIDDNWETYAPQHGHYAPSESTALGESDPNDPPPPYVP